MAASPADRASADAVSDLYLFQSGDIFVHDDDGRPRYCQRTTRMKRRNLTGWEAYSHAKVLRCRPDFADALGDCVGFSWGTSLTCHKQRMFADAVSGPAKSLSSK
jgi:hypothetical protein